MDANSFLKRITLIALVSALPTFVSVASPGGGGHSSGGSSGGHSSSGSKGGHSAGDPSMGPASGGGGRSVSGMHISFKHSSQGLSLTCQYARFQQWWSL
jgi:hypothetical protein